MEFLFGGMFNEPSSAGGSFAHHVQRCPFLKNINEPTSFSFSSPSRLPRTVREGQGPIFEDDPDFETAFRLFHGKNGVVPLSERAFMPESIPKPDPAPQFNPLATKAATISLSSFGFGPSGPFNFDSFAKKWNKNGKKSSEGGSSQGNGSSHESMSNEWLETGQCPIAKSYRAVSHVLPLVAKALQPPPGMKIKCPPAVVAARAALARTALVKTLRPQPLPAKMLAIALLGMAANVPLGVWREHTKKFSLEWIVAVHAAVPFIAMLRKSVVMPKTAMAITVAASVLGQTIGSRAERMRMKALAEGNCTGASPCGKRIADGGESKQNCRKEMTWDPLALNMASISTASSSKGEACF